MSEYKGIYKCRLCGKEFSERGYCNVSASDIISSTKMPNDMWAVHRCDDGSLGNSDFLGYRYEEEKDGLL